MRKVEIVTVEFEGRDKGKRFQITEMPASAGEEWAARAIMTLAQSGPNVPDASLAGLKSAGMEGLFALGVAMLEKVSFSELKPLLDDMWKCVQSVQPAAVRPLIEDDIEEVQTRLWLRRKVLELHTGFFSDASASNSQGNQPAA